MSDVIVIGLGAVSGLVVLAWIDRWRGRRPARRGQMDRNGGGGGGGDGFWDGFGDGGCGDGGGGGD
ncbi:MAG: hypothetical protein AAF646_06725 [Pseudomonadota bacterium]